VPKVQRIAYSPELHERKAAQHPTVDERGGTGRTWDWELARPLLAARSVFIAGGLEPGNVGKVVSAFKPYGVDVSSGVEASVRVKDPDKVRAFVHAVRLAEALM